jgi:hypothetical protein
LGLDKAPAKSTACDGLRNRDSKIFEDLYFTLVKHYHSFLSDSRTYGLTFKEVLLIDSTTIRLFSNILKGVGRNPKGDGKKKGELKVHMLIDAVQSVGRFIKITAVKVHDKNFLKSIELISHSLEYHPEDKNGIRNLKIKRNVRLRKVSYQDEQNRYFEFLTNNFDIQAFDACISLCRRKSCNN